MSGLKAAEIDKEGQGGNKQADGGRGRGSKDGVRTEQALLISRQLIWSRVSPLWLVARCAVSCQLKPLDQQPRDRNPLSARVELMTRAGRRISISCESSTKDDRCARMKENGGHESDRSGKMKSKRGEIRISSSSLLLILHIQIALGNMTCQAPSTCRKLMCHVGGGSNRCEYWLASLLANRGSNYRFRMPQGRRL